MNSPSSSTPTREISHTNPKKLSAIAANILKDEAQMSLLFERVHRLFNEDLNRNNETISPYTQYRGIK